MNHEILTAEEEKELLVAMPIEDQCDSSGLNFNRKNALPIGLLIVVTCNSITTDGYSQHL